ncbi:hypothetical protein [Streptomyces sp. NPDC015414]|uniref:hypothetical protein n=1 Tax=Streptomyces sp. NPDC015414 TaxID=3364957 RepID=UPI0036FB2C40
MALAQGAWPRVEHGTESVGWLIFLGIVGLAQSTPTQGEYAERARAELASAAGTGIRAVHPDQ